MFIYHTTQLEKKGILQVGVNELMMDGKTLVPSISMSKYMREAVIDICQREMNSGRICIAVENNYSYILWKEKIDTQIEDTKTTQAETIPQHLQSSKLNKEFINKCKEQLIELVGPIGSFIIDDIYEEHPQISEQKFIALVSEEIPQDEQKEKFKSSFSH